MNIYSENFLKSFITFGYFVYFVRMLEKLKEKNYGTNNKLHVIKFNHVYFVNFSRIKMQLIKQLKIKIIKKLRNRT